MGEEALPQGWVQVCSSEAWVQAGLPRGEDQRMGLDLEVAAADHDLCSEWVEEGENWEDVGAGVGLDYSSWVAVLFGSSLVLVVGPPQVLP